jgi:hypothetical protein
MASEYLSDKQVEEYINKILGYYTDPIYNEYSWLRRQLAQGLVVARIDNQLGLVLYGDRHNGRPHAWMLFDDGSTRRARLSKDCLVFGSISRIYYPPKIRVGTYGVMGAIAKGIRTGRAFRGR